MWYCGWKTHYWPTSTQRTWTNFLWGLMLQTETGSWKQHHRVIQRQCSISKQTGHSVRNYFLPDQGGGGGAGSHFSIFLCLAGLWKVNSTICSSQSLLWHKNALSVLPGEGPTLPLTALHPNHGTPLQTHLSLCVQTSRGGKNTYSSMEPHENALPHAIPDEKLLFVRMTFACSFRICKLSSPGVMATAEKCLLIPLQSFQLFKAHKATFHLSRNLLSSFCNSLCIQPPNVIHIWCIKRYTTFKEAAWRFCLKLGG